MTDQPFRVGFLAFPRMTQLDMTGPYEVLARMPGSEIHLLWKRAGTVETEHGLTLGPVSAWSRCPALDLLCVPGGFGVNALLDDEETLAFLREQGGRAGYVTAVCTGSLALGAAGLLQGRRATSHWMSREHLAAFGAVPVDERVVVDGNVITGGGVTAGIDFALTVVAEILGREAAERIQLAIEYDPAPPFAAGSPRTAGAPLVAGLREAWASSQEERKARVQRAAARLAV